MGCAFGTNVFSLNYDFGKERDLEFFGVDLDPLGIYFCNLKKEKHQAGNCTFTVMNAESLDYPDKSFDILLSVEVLEHLRRPESAVNEFYRVLKPGGLAIITTPNGSNLLSKPRKILQSVLGISGKDQPSAGPNERIGYGHISVKSLKEWVGILSESGFKVEKTKKGQPSTRVNAAR